MGRIDGPDQPANSYIYARKLFELASKPQRDTTPAHSKYKLYVNGEYVGKGRCAAGRAIHIMTPRHHLASEQGQECDRVSVHHIGEDTNAARR